MVRCPYPAPDRTPTQSIALLHSHIASSAYQNGPLGIHIESAPPGAQGSGTWCGLTSASQPLLFIRYLKAQAHSVH